MPAYRIYSLTHDNRIKGVPEIIECESDRDVIAHVKTKLDRLDLEIWDGPRIVLRLKSTDHG
jgi:hypothetical protein